MSYYSYSDSGEAEGGRGLPYRRRRGLEDFAGRARKSDSDERDERRSEKPTLKRVNSKRSVLGKQGSVYKFESVRDRSSPPRDDGLILMDTFFTPDVGARPDPTDGRAKPKKTKFHDSFAKTLLDAYDKRVRLRNRISFLLSLIAIGLGILMMELSWDSDLAKERDPNMLEFALKASITVVTGFHMANVVSYYRFQTRQEHKGWFVIDSALWRRHRNKFLALELGVLALHPFPTAVDSRPYRNAAAIVLLIRLYTVVRCIRDICPIYRHRRIIRGTEVVRASGSLEFNWVLTLRYYFLHYMWYVSGMMLFMSLFIFAYSMYVLERLESPDWSFRTALWNTAVTMTTVGYGDKVPTWTGSRVSAGFAAIVGILLSSVLIFVIITSLDYTAVERQAHNQMQVLKINHSQRRVAATLIQVQWRFHQYERHHWHSDPSDVKSLRYKKYRMQTLVLKGKLRKYRRRQAMIMAEAVELRAKETGEGVSRGADADRVTQVLDRLESRILNRLERIERRQARLRNALREVYPEIDDTLFDSDTETYYSEDDHSYMSRPSLRSTLSYGSYDSSFEPYSDVYSYSYDGQYNSANSSSGTFDDE